MIKNLEYYTPRPVARMLMQFFWPQKNPYSERNDELKTLFIHVPKTGGTSLTSALCAGRALTVPVGRYAAYDPLRLEALFGFANADWFGYSFNGIATGAGARLFLRDYP